jgi:peptide/nickel transport system substrate-binding protein
MYDYLVMLDQQLNTQPSLATGWSVSDDGLTWTFKLQEGVKFHNGRELTAADVKYSMERIMNPETASTIATRLSMVESIETPDDYTVAFNLSTPNAVLAAALADPRAAIVAKEIVEEHGDLSQVEAGSGPFKFVSLEVDETVVLERNPDYWQMGADGEPLPYVDRLELMPIPDNSARNTALRTGDVDIITFVTTNFISLLREESDIVIPENATSAQYYYLLMNCTTEPFSDVKIRQAIMYALDRETIAQVALGGEGYPLLAGNIPPWHWAAIQDPIYPKSDLEKAKQLLAESSAPDGFEFELRVWSPQDYVLRAAQVIYDQLAPLNITPKIEQHGEWASYWAPVTEGNFEATIQGTGGNTDPDFWTYEPFHTKGGKNYGKYSNPEVDKLLEQGREVSDQGKRKEIYAEAQRITAAEGPMAFLFNMNQTEAWRDYVKGFYHLPTMHIIALKETWLDK